MEIRKPVIFFTGFLFGFFIKIVAFGCFALFKDKLIEWKR
jgi:hypothetical protein